jgi:hypothetical protein
MTIRQFAIPLNDQSKQSGDITFKAVADAGVSATFRLTNVTAAGSGNQLNLITKKSGQTTDHIYSIAFGSGIASVTISSGDLSSIYQDAGTDWDYVEAKWSIGASDTPNPSVFEIVQSNVVYDRTGWPPKTS